MLLASLATSWWKVLMLGEVGLEEVYHYITGYQNVYSMNNATELCKSYNAGQGGISPGVWLAILPTCSTQKPTSGTINFKLKLYFHSIPTAIRPDSHPTANMKGCFNRYNILPGWRVNLQEQCQDYHWAVRTPLWALSDRNLEAFGIRVNLSLLVAAKI